MAEYTPTREQVEQAWMDRQASLDRAFNNPIDGLSYAAEFRAFLAAHDESVRAAERAAERERIARNMDAEQRRARAAWQAAQTDHFTHDYCRWVGHAEAFGTAARIVREGADA